MKNFALIGVAGYIAEKHLKAIKETGNKLVVAFDKCDSVGILDKYFPEADFFVEFERFDRHIDKLRRKRDKNKIDYISICSPNYLHDAHIRFALKNGANAICEKPLVLNPWNLEALQDLEQETGKKIFTILQLRYHPTILFLKKYVETQLKVNPNKIFEIELTYITSRGKWYFISWKGNESKSGGIASNIGIHFFDMLLWIFGDVQENIVNIKTLDTNAGFLKLKNANVKWFLSVNKKYLPEQSLKNYKTTFRSIKIDNKEIEFSEGFTNLHTICYREILNGNGYGTKDVKNSIELISAIRHKKPIGSKSENYHPFCKKI